MARDYLAEIVARKRCEITRRKRFAAHFTRWADELDAQAGEDGLVSRRARVTAALTKPTGAMPRVIAEVKFQSPSAGVIRPWVQGAAVDIARRYEAAGASAVSVLADGPGFGGSVLRVRRVSETVTAPVLFKEFVLDPLQVDVARVSGAHLVLLLVRCLSPEMMRTLVALIQARGMVPVVEAADEGELDLALATESEVVGVNARDLRTFKVDKARAARALDVLPQGRVGVLMSGISTADDVRLAQASRADAVLIGEGLMRAEDPGTQLRALFLDANDADSR